MVFNRSSFFFVSLQLSSRLGLEGQHFFLTWYPSWIFIDRPLSLLLFCHLYVGQWHSRIDFERLWHAPHLLWDDTSKCLVGIFCFTILYSVRFGGIVVIRLWPTRLIKSEDPNELLRLLKPGEWGSRWSFELVWVPTYKFLRFSLFKIR